MESYNSPPRSLHSLFPNACDHIMSESKGPGTSVVYLLDKLREIYQRPLYIANDFRVALGRLRILYCGEKCGVPKAHNREIRKALDSISEACNKGWEDSPEECDARTTKIFNNLVSLEQHARGAERFMESDCQVTREEIWDVPERFEAFLKRLKEVCNA